METVTSSKLPKIIMIALATISLGSSAGAYYFYDQYSTLKENPQQQAQNEIASTLEKISRYMELPTDEQPTVATVSDPEKLKAQPFFSKAKVGYKVIIYTTAKKAILYDPTADRIIEVAPVNIGNTQPADGVVAGDEDEEDEE